MKIERFASIKNAEKSGYSNSDCKDVRNEYDMKGMREMNKYSGYRFLEDATEDTLWKIGKIGPGIKARMQKLAGKKPNGVDLGRDLEIGNEI